ncbi:MAG TPA: ion channel [Bryobacteraceae bacterium]|jgi:inward rectifier potassium channel|nr:ion channel [Bryobacteraceae bacterium]
MAINPDSPPAQGTSFDPGLTQKYTQGLKRMINPDGRFNVRRTGATWRDFHPYLFLVDAPLPIFLGVILVGYFVGNLVFAGIYWAIGVEHLHGTAAATPFLTFVNAFFFSAHTLTTVGYGNFYPEGVLANTVAALEALVGLMTFALGTGILFGRFSRPSARIGYSKRMVIAPYRETTSLQFRIVNRRPNNLLNLQAQVLLMTVQLGNGLPRRKFDILQLERDSVIFFPLPWTIVHPITETSPLYGKTPEDFSRLQVEVLIMIKAIDETFGQLVHSRFSYRFDEIEWGAKFAPVFDVEASGDLLLELNRVSEIERLLG